VYAHDINGNPTYGSIQSLIGAVQEGAPVRFNIGTGDAMMDGQTVEIQNNVVCAQNTSHISIDWVGNSMRLSDNPYHAYYIVCTTADVNISRWLTGTHTAMGVTNYKEPIKWFVQNEHELTQTQILDDLKAYYHTKTYFGDKALYRVGDVYEIYPQSKLRRLNFDSVVRINARALRNEIYARHGRSFTAPEVAYIFESAPWYKPRPDFQESELSEMERKNVSYLDDYEKMQGWK